MPNRPSDPYDPRYQPPRSPQFESRDEDPRFDSHEPDSGFDPRYESRDERYDPPRDPDRRAGGPPPPPASPPPRRSRGGLLAILAGLAALLLVGLFAYRLTRAGPGEDRLAENGAAAADGPAAPDERCGSQQTYDQVKRELFRQAAQVRGSDQATFDRLSGYSAIRVDAPVLKRSDEASGTLVCSGRVALDLPPGVGVVGGRRTLEAQMDYALQSAADGSGNVVTLSGADPILVPLATLARTGSQPGLPQPQPGTTEPIDYSDVLPPSVPGAPPPPEAPAPASRPANEPAPPPVVRPPAPQPQASIRPSFSCASARTRGEIAVCRNDRLATLDRQMSGQFFSALRSADPEQRALLQRTRGAFLAFRDRCGSDACVAGAYQDRIREIRDIMNDRWNGRR